MFGNSYSGGFSIISDYDDLYVCVVEGIDGVGNIVLRRIYYCFEIDKYEVIGFIVVFFRKFVCYGNDL